MTRSAVVILVVVALAGCGSASRQANHSASGRYSVRQVERAFAGQGVRLRSVTTRVWRPFWSSFDGRPAHAVYVYVISQACKCVQTLPISNARKTHHGNVVVVWRPSERPTVRAALRELR